MIWIVPTSAGPVTVREQIEPDDEPAILDLFTDCEDWFVAASGLPSAPGDVQSLFYALPEGKDFDDKRLFLVLMDGTVVGLIDAVLRYPDVRSCAVGLFLIRPSHRRRGIGTAVARHLLDEARELGFDRLTAPVTPGVSAGVAFARSLGCELALRRGDRPIRRAVLTLR